MNTERTEKFVNAIACDLEEGGFRQVSGTMLRRTLSTAVSAALPLLQSQTGTPSSRWVADGQPDPHGDRYARERAVLALGHLTDDELANAVYLHGNEQPSMADLVAGKALSGIVYLTAAKERIRWLSRALAASRAEAEGLKRDAERYRMLRAHADHTDEYRIGPGGTMLVGYAEGEDIFNGEQLDMACDAAMENGNV